MYTSCTQLAYSIVGKQAVSDTALATRLAHLK
uniref:Uncharacterized protein n=1 Tax=Anguilla anguilla TaxID=7936 RepID=A0A0E9WPP2_ANGAN